MTVNTVYSPCNVYYTVVMRILFQQVLVLVTSSIIALSGIVVFHVRSNLKQDMDTNFQSASEDMLLQGHVDKEYPR